MRADFDPIDHILALDLGARGIAGFFVPHGALAAAAGLRAARRVLIATGFTVAADTPETDGPPGATVLGRALRRLGAQVTYVTDPHNVPIVEAALKALAEPVDIEVYPEGEGAAPSLLARARPTHLIAVERPGRAASGEYMNLRGVVITPWNRRIDELFLVAGGGRTGSREGAGNRRASPPGSASGRFTAQSACRRAQSASDRPVTIGVGDGGNEIGMGTVRRRLLRAGGLIARTASVVRVDHLVVAATSNWGAYGIVAALARATGEALLHTPDTERRLIEACVEAGAFDGVTRRREATVDGFGVDTHGAVVELLRLAVRPHRR
ncbi:MAG: DUF4392 domain-containing protein [Candidatus Rokubacteria bacterium]|nr:DUF4392 domain-containing protein [Candidatus Rokubacteria bacterium]